LGDVWLIFDDQYLLGGKGRHDITVD
jgi:hypothetical protein